jgi:intracellular multiplication protein IcmJ
MSLLIQNKNLPLHLFASADSWRLFSSRKADPNFLSFEKRVFERDQYQCLYCGFQAHQHQEVVNIDRNFRNNKFDNLATSCIFCTQCFFLESIGVGGFGGGILIYFPELSQNKINSICHVLFCAISNNSAYKTIAQNIYLNMKLRTSVLEQKFGEGSSDPSTFGHLLIDSKHYGDQKIQQLLNGVRLLPSRAKFRTQIESWASKAIDHLNKDNPA